MNDHDAPGNTSLPASLRHFDERVARVGWRAWAGLAGFGCAISAALVWSVVGDIPTRVRGNCIIMSPDGLGDVTADADGRISQVLVKPGQLVAPGQTLALLSIPDLNERVQATRLRLADLETSMRLHVAETQAQRQLSGKSVDEQGKALRLREQSDLQRIAIAQQQIDNTVRLRSEGLVTARSAATATLDLQDAQTALADTRRKLAALGKLSNEFERKQLETEQRLALQIDAGRRELASLEAQSEAAGRLRSQVAGRVIEIKAALGSLVRRGTPVLSIERQDQGGAPLEAVMYVSAADGKKISSGDQVQITLAHAAREEFGALLAKVDSTSAYPATPQGLQNTIANADLVRELALGAAPYELRIGLLRAAAATGTPAARNPYRWTNRAGSSLPLSGGALCAGEILVRHERPLSLVLPIFRSTVSGATH
jgi:HlyD family secretion protein